MAWPSTVGSFTNPLPTNKLNAPSHSSIETAQNTALSELETFIGTTSSTVGTLMYDVRAAASSGGGHIQTANKGGTGQTTYTKGDLLVASSASVLSKLTLGATNQILQADSSQSTGLKWANIAPTYALISSSILTASASVLAVSSIAAGTKILRASGYLRATNNNDSLFITLNNEATGNYHYESLNITSTTVTAVSVVGQNQIVVPSIATSSGFANFEMMIQNDAAGTQKEGYIRVYDGDKGIKTTSFRWSTTTTEVDRIGMAFGGQAGFVASSRIIVEGSTVN